MSQQTPQEQMLLTPGEVATMFRVDPKTVGRWALAGKLGSTRTLGGHRRYFQDEVVALLKANYTQAEFSKRLEKLEEMIAARLPGRVQ